MSLRPDPAALRPCLVPTVSIAQPRLSIQHRLHRNDGGRSAVFRKEPCQSARLDLGWPFVIADIQPEPRRIPEILASFPRGCGVEIYPRIRQPVHEHSVTRADIPMADDLAAAAK